MCKRQKFGLADKYYKHKLESVLENEVHKILWEFEIQTDDQISRRSLSENKRMRKDWLIHRPWQSEHMWIMKVTVIPIIVGVSGTVSKRSGKVNGLIGDQW